MIEQRQFLDGINRKKRTAWESLYQYFYGALCSYADRIVKDSAVAEDIVQECFIAVWNSGTSFNDMKALRVYFYRATYNNSIKYLRDKRIDDNRLKIWQEGQEEVTDDAFYQAVEEEVIRKINVVISQLPPQQEKVLRLALEPEERSSYLYRSYAQGNCPKDVLLRYAAYMAQRRQMQEALPLLQEAVEKYDLSLKDKDVADFFFDFFTVAELDHPLALQFFAQREEMGREYGKTKVERKMFSLYRFVRERQEIEELENFRGKRFLLLNLDFERELAAKNYEVADRIIWAMLEDPEIDREDVYEVMKFVSRATLKRGGENGWKKKCLSYLQFIAYNQPERKDPEIHFYYACMLESFIRENPEIHPFFPRSVVQKPLFEREGYSLNSRVLAPKKQ